MKANADRRPVVWIVACVLLAAGLAGLFLLGQGGESGDVGPPSGAAAPDARGGAPRAPDADPRAGEREALREESPADGYAVRSGDESAPGVGDRRSLTGLVVRADSSGIAEAEVEVFVLGLDGPRVDLSECAKVRTDGAGRFVSAVPDRTPLLIRARAEGYAPAWTSPVFGGQEIELTLLEPGQLVVRVVDEDGRALADSRVEAFREDAHRASVWRWAGLTDADGSAQIEGLPPGRMAVRARREGLAQANAGVVVESAGRHELELILGRGLRLHGRVSAMPGGEPLEGVRVGHHTGAGTLTDVRGEYALSGINPSQNAWAVLASKPGYEPTYRYLQLHDDTGDQRLDFELVPAPSVRGRVVDSAGRAVPGVRVLAQGHQLTHAFTAEHPRAELWTDEAGEFVLDPVHPSSHWTFTVRGPGTSCARLATGPLLALLDAAESVGGRPVIDVGVLVLTEVASIEGRVHGLEAGLSEARVALSSLDDSWDSMGVTLGLRIPDPWGGFRFDDLAPGRYRLELSGSTDVLAVSEFELEPGERREVRLLPGRSVLGGTVFDPAGRPLERGSLRLAARDAQDRVAARGAPGPGGRFELQLPGDGDHSLEVSDATRQLEDEVLTGLQPGTRNLMVRLRKRTGGVALEGWVLSSDGRPVDPGVYVAFRDADTMTPLGRVAIPGERGAFRMENLAPVPYLAEVVDFKGLYAPPRARLVTPGGEPIEIVLDPRR